MTTIEKRLKPYGFTLEDWTRARAFYDARKISLGYGGRGRFRGKFHASHLKPDDKGAFFVSVRADSPQVFFDEPSKVVEGLHSGEPTF